MRLGKLVDDARAGLAAFERRVEKFEANQKEAAKQQALVLQEVKNGREQVANQAILQKFERKGLNEQAKHRRLHLQEAGRLKEEHSAALAEFKAPLLASHSIDRRDLEAEAEHQRRSRRSKI